MGDVQPHVPPSMGPETHPSILISWTWHSPIIIMNIHWRWNFLTLYMGSGFNFCFLFFFTFLESNIKDSFSIHLEILTLMIYVTHTNFASYLTRQDNIVTLLWKTTSVSQSVTHTTLTKAAVLLPTGRAVVGSTPLLELLASSPPLVASRALWGTIPLGRITLLLRGSTPPLVWPLHHALCAHVASHLTVVRA